MTLIRPCIDKVRYLTEGAALRGASWTNAVKRKRIGDQRTYQQWLKKMKAQTWIRRAYQCPHCAGWHLTSQGKERAHAR